MERMIITVARQYGSGGKAVGEKLARRLGIDFYGKEELMALAKERQDRIYKLYLTAFYTPLL